MRPKIDIFILPRPEDDHGAEHFDGVPLIASCPTENAFSFIVASVISLLRGSQEGSLSWAHAQRIRWPPPSHAFFWVTFTVKDVFTFDDDDMGTARHFLTKWWNPDTRASEREGLALC